MSKGRHAFRDRRHGPGLTGHDTMAPGLPSANSRMVRNAPRADDERAARLALLAGGTPLALLFLAAATGVLALDAVALAAAAGAALAPAAVLGLAATRRHGDRSVTANAAGGGRDELTRISDRAALMAALDEVRAQATREHGQFAVALLDIDRFRTVNEEYGHRTGDRVLCDFAATVRRGLRDDDRVWRQATFGRYSGEEFLLILAGADLDGAERCAERLRKLVAGARFAGEHRLTLSAGVAEHRPGEHVEDLLRRVEGAVWLAKQSGRNRVERGAPVSDTPPLAEVVELRPAR
jgi:diguanylate cyclase (GGDEF)-like protein